MARIAKYAREALVKIVEARRQSGRCQIVKKLTDEGKVISKEYDDKMSKKEAKITKLQSEINCLCDERDKLLNENRLHSGNFSKSENGACRWRQLHPELEAYDAQTDHCVIEFMTLPEVDESTIIELLGESDE